MGDDKERLGLRVSAYNLYTQLNSQPKIEGKSMVERESNR